MKLILEQRFLFDGSVAAIGHAAAHTDTHHPLHADSHDAAHAPAFAAHEAPGAGPSAHPAAFDAPSAAPRAAGSSTVLVVDPSVANWQALTAGARPGVDVIVLDPAKDGVSQVSAALRGLSGVKNLEFLTNGAAGQISLGAGQLDLTTLTSRAGEIAGWSAALAPHADIVFWGCDAGSGSAGAAFVGGMHTLTGATIGASSGATGSAAHGGNWTLETTTGALHKDVQPFGAEARAAYTGVLDTPLPTVTLSATDITSSHVAPGTVLLGDQISLNMSFSNGALHATGFGPYVELFAPSSLTLSGVSSSGISLTAQSATVVGGSYLNPLTHLTETALSGITTGSVYFMQLPYGSFTPGEPPVSLSATLGFAPGLTTSQLSGLVGTSLPIEARGGFQFGALATGGTPILQATPATAPETVELVESWLQVATQPGEGETATGPDFPVQYTLYVEPAPAVLTSGVPITHLDTAIPLPSGIIATGVPSATGGGVASLTSAAVSGGTQQTLHVDYATLSGVQTVTFSAYVPQFYQFTDATHTSGAPILDPATGTAVPITVSPAYTYSADNWNGIAIQNVPGDVSAATFLAKSLAVQLVADTSSALPTQDINYTLRFEVSDYFGVSGLHLGAVLGDGLTFDPSVAPVLSVAGKNGGVSGGGTFGLASNSPPVTINGEQVNPGGSGAFVNYAFDGGSSGTTVTGQTTVNFDVGGLLPGQYGAGTTGSVTFAGTVLDKYPTQTDQLAGAGGFLRESDSVSTSSNTALDFATALSDFAAGAYVATGNPIADDTATPVDTLPNGALSLNIVSIGGVPYTGQQIVPGQTVVYELVYALAAPGDFGGLNLSAYVPEPVFSVVHPANPDVTTAADYAGSGTSQFTAVPGAAALTLAPGTYTYSVSSGLAGTQVTGGTGVEPSNSISFAVQSGSGQPFDNSSTGVGGPQQVVIDFALTASSLPFINGLSLTAQADSAYTPARAAVISQQTTKTVLLAEPLITTITQGVVSVVDDTGTSISTSAGLTWTQTDASGSTSAATAPTLFAPAGSGSVFASGATIPVTPAASQINLDVAGVQAGDTVRIVDTVQNVGGLAAYDLIVKDALAQGFTPADVSHLSFTRGDGTVMETIDPDTGAVVTGAAAISAYFNGGLLLAVPGGGSVSADLAAPALQDGTSAAGTVYASYDLTLPAATPTAAKLTGQATTVAWTNQDVYATTGTGYALVLPSGGADANFAHDSALGATLTDTATVATVAPSITDIITGAGNTSDPATNAGGIPANSFDTHNATVVPGETVTFRTTVTLPQGVNTVITVKDVLPAGFAAVPGSLVATYIDGSGAVDAAKSAQVTGDASFSGTTLALAPDTWTVPESAGGDKAATIVFTYQATVPGTAKIDASSWTAGSLSSHNTTLTDSYAAPGEGLGYATTTADTNTATTGSATLSGQANTVTVTHPLVIATITDPVSGNVYTGETITYTLTLTNVSGTATAYDLASTITIPAGLTYVAGSLANASGAPATLAPGNIGTPGNALDGITLAPGASSTFTFQAAVDPNLPSGTVLTVSAKPDWQSLPANPAIDGVNANPIAQAYGGAPGSVSNSVGVIVPSLSIIGESNATAGSGTAFDPLQTVSATDGEIVRMRAVLQIPEGQNSNTQIEITLPTGLTFANGSGNTLTDGSTTAALLSPSFAGGLGLTSTVIGSGAQLATGGTAVDLTHLGLGLGAADPVTTVLANSAITAGTQTATFNLGTLTDNDQVSTSTQVVVEFNAIVSNTAPNGTPLVTTLQFQSNGGAPTPATPTAATTDTVLVAAPVVTLQKTITGIDYSGGNATVTYTDTITNTGSAPAYTLALDDPGAGSSGTITAIGTPSGGGTGVAGGSTGGSSLTTTLDTLPAGASETFTYTVTLPASAITPTLATDSAGTATVTSYALDPLRESGGTTAQTTEVLLGTSHAPAQSTATDVAGLDLVTGTVNQDLGAQGTDLPGSLLPLAGQSVTVGFTGQTGVDSVTTGSDGSYGVLVPADGGVVKIVTTTASPPAPLQDAIDNAPALSGSVPGGSVTGTDPATLTFTPAPGATYTAVDFDFWRAPDTAPVLANGPGAPIATVTGNPVVPFPTATVSDTQLDGSFGSDYSGTTLTIQRTNAGLPAPDATDVFTGSGGLSLGGNTVVLGGVPVGTYTETGGVLTITFASTGVSKTTVDSVLNQIAYISTAGGNSALPPVVIGAQIDDANNDPVALGGNKLDPAGPHDQGPGGDLLSNVLTAAIAVSPIAPGLSIIGESNITTGTGQLFDPTGQTAGTAVTVAPGDIVRMRAVVELPEGANSAANMVVTLPNGLTFLNDGSTNVLLVTPGGNAVAPSLGSFGGLQGAGPADQTRLDLSLSGSDPVTAPLGSGAIGVSGQAVTFALGTITNPATQPGGNYAIVEFNAAVSATATATSTPLVSTLVAGSNGQTTGTVSDFITVVAPKVTLTKTIESIVYNPDGSATVTYRDTETNTGNSPAYDVKLNDPGAGPGTTVTYTGPGPGGNIVSAGPNGSDFNSTITRLDPGAAQTFTYSVTIPPGQIAQVVTDSTGTATLTSTPLNPANETGGRETLTVSSLAPPIDTTTASAGLDVISGTVSQDTGPTSGGLTPLVPLAGQTVTVTFPGQTTPEATVTDSSGHYVVLVPDSGVPVTLTVSAAPPVAPTQDALDNPTQLAGSVPGGTVSGTDPASVTFTPAPGTSYTAVDYDFWRAPDTAPVLSGAPASPIIATTGTPVAPFPSVTVADAELDGSFGHDFSGTTLTVQRYVGNTAAPDAADVFTSGGTATSGLFFSGGPSGSGNVVLGGVVVGTYTETGGKLTIAFAPTGVSSTTVDAVMNGITYVASLPVGALVPGIVIGVQIDDANNDPIPLGGNPLDPSGPHDQGPGGDLLSNVLKTTLNAQGLPASATFIEPNDSNPAAAAVVVASAIDLTDIAHTAGTPSQITLSVAGGRAEDVLSFTNTPGITGTYAGGTMTLTAVPGASPTLADWQAAVRSVAFHDSSDVPDTTTRNITVTVTSGGNTASILSTVAIHPVNDSPILDTTIPVALTDSAEYQGSAAPPPAGTVGTLVSQLAGTVPGNVADGDGAGLISGGVPGAAGIAITGFNTADAGGRSVGTWFYSIDNGSTWTAFPASISATQPLDLASTARIAFQPAATNFNGQIPNAITFRAWDQFDGTADGTQANLSGVTLFGQNAAPNTAATAYSIATESLPLMIDNVNNAPDAAGRATLPPVSVAEQHPQGQTVAQLFGPGFSDPRDLQYIAGANPYGSTPNGFAGIAITGNAAPHSQGTWEYSVDGGSHWTAIPSTVSTASAIILPAGAKIAFQPNGSFSGNPGQLTVHLIDSSPTLIAPGVTGLTLAGERPGGSPLAAITGVDVTLNGGSTAISSQTMPLNTTVTPLTPPPPAPPPPFNPNPQPSTFPDDNNHTPDGTQFWTTDDYLNRPLIPDLSLVGSVANRFVIVQQHAVVAVPRNIFQDSLPQAQLTFEAKLPDGSSLPSWISFNSNDLTFSGTPPADSHGRLSILIKARDIAGNTADATFNILIGRQQGDLLKLLRGRHHGDLYLPNHPATAGQALRAAIDGWADAEHALAQRQTAPDPAPVDAVQARLAQQAAALAGLPPPGAAAGGFSAALHAAGPLSALGRARAWLDSLDDMVRQRPAA